MAKALVGLDQGKGILFKTNEIGQTVGGTDGLEGKNVKTAYYVVHVCTHSSARFGYGSIWKKMKL